MIEDIKNFPGYKVTNIGIIYNKNGIALSYQYRHGFKKTGHPYKPYPRVCLYKNNRPKWFSVHKLVALHFVPNPKNLPIIHHIDGNPKNPKAFNLKWVTYSENIRHALDEGLISIENKIKGAKHYGDHPGSIKVKIIHKQTGNELEFDSISRLREFFQKPNTVSIHEAIREPNRTVKGYYIRKVN